LASPTAQLRPDRNSIRLASLVAAIAVVLSGVGCSVREDERDGEGTAAVERRAVPRLVDATRIEGGLARAQSLLERTVAGMEKTSLRAIAIRRAQPETGRRATTIRFETIAAETVRRQWDAWVVAGAFSRRLLAAGLPARVNAQDDRGAFTARPRLKGEPDPRPLRKNQEAALVDALRRAAAGAKAEVVALEVHRPYGAAVAVSLAPANTAAFLRTRLRTFLRSLEEHRAKLEGVYLAVLDEERELALEWGSWTRNPAGVYWVRHDLANCSPIRQSDPPGADPPPPCPS
jgi:hypothetical protein